MGWEYRYAEAPVGEDFAAWLSAHGREGWEVVTCQQGVKVSLAGQVPVWIVVFKRPVKTVVVKLPDDGRRHSLAGANGQ